MLEICVSVLLLSKDTQIEALVYSAEQSEHS